MMRGSKSVKTIATPQLNPQFSTVVGAATVENFHPDSPS
jgi:hypothetical protein